MIPSSGLVLPNYARARDRWPNAPALVQYYSAILECIRGNTHGTTEHVKSFIECVCITILGECGQALPASTPTCTQLLTEALRSLGLENQRGASKLDKVLNGFNKLADAISEMRNDNGPVAHGKDGFLDVLEEDHARAFLHTGDAIVGLLLNALEGKQPNLLVTREPYERFKHLCDRIDRSIQVTASVDEDSSGSMLVVSLAVWGKPEGIELRIEPSRLLYGIDRTAFIGMLSDVPEAIVGQLDQADQEEVSEVSTDSLPLSGLIKESKRLRHRRKDSSRDLLGLKAGLDTFLVSESISKPSNKKLLSSLLAVAEENSGVDWKERESLQARMKVGFGRILRKEGMEQSKASDASLRLLTWFKSNAPS